MNPKNFFLVIFLLVSFEQQLFSPKRAGTRVSPDQEGRPMPLGGAVRDIESSPHGVAQLATQVPWEVKSVARIPQHEAAVVEPVLAFSSLAYVLQFNRLLLEKLLLSTSDHLEAYQKMAESYGDQSDDFDDKKELQRELRELKGTVRNKITARLLIMIIDQLAALSKCTVSLDELRKYCCPEEGLTIRFNSRSRNHEVHVMQPQLFGSEALEVVHRANIFIPKSVGSKRVVYGRGGFIVDNILALKCFELLLNTYCNILNKNSFTKSLFKDRMYKDCLTDFVEILFFLSQRVLREQYCVSKLLILSDEVGTYCMPELGCNPIIVYPTPSSIDPALVL